MSFEEVGAAHVARDGAHVLVAGHVHDARQLDIPLGRRDHTVASYGRPWPNRSGGGEADCPVARPASLRQPEARVSAQTPECSNRKATSAMPACSTKPWISRWRFSGERPATVTVTTTLPSG